MYAAEGEEGHKQQLGGLANVQQPQQVPKQDHVNCPEGHAEVNLRRVSAPDRHKGEQKHGRAGREREVLNSTLNRYCVLIEISDASRLYVEGAVGDSVGQVDLMLIPAPGSGLVSWTPVPIGAYGESNQIQGRTVRQEGRKVIP